MHCSVTLKSQWLLYVTSALMLTVREFCPQSAFICPLRVFTMQNCYCPEHHQPICLPEAFHLLCGMDWCSVRYLDAQVAILSQILCE
jgi:hypothetical protein